MTTRVNYSHELDSLRDSLEEMGHNVEHSIDKLFEAVDNMNEELLQEIIKSDRVVNDMERNIEAQCLSIITRQQPIASDLRMVSAALKVVTDIERIGDHAVDIAELIMRCNHVSFLPYSSNIRPMIEASKKMVHRAVETFVKRDTIGAGAVIESDDIVDELFNQVKNDMINLLRNGEKNIDMCVDILMIAKYLEKIGDHAVNIAEWEIFRETGTIQNVRLL